MSTLGRRPQSGEGSMAAYTSGHSIGEMQEPWQEHLRERGSWGEMAGEDVYEDATSGKRKEEKEELGKSQILPALEELPTADSPAENPDPLTEAVESSESWSESEFEDERATRVIKNVGRELRGNDREREFAVPKSKARGGQSVHAFTDEKNKQEIEENLSQVAAQKSRQGERDPNAPTSTAGISDPTPTSRTQTGTGENKFYVYKAPHKVIYTKPWTWRFRRAKSADETESTAGEGYYYVHKKRPPPSWLFWKWTWQGPKPISWIPIYPSYFPEKDDPELKIFLVYSCGHRFPTRVISGPDWTASSPSFLFSPSSPFTPNTPTYPRAASTTGHTHICPLPSFRTEILRAAARNEGIKNIVSPENYVCPNCFLWRQWFAGLCLMTFFWGVFTWYFAFVWPYTWWATDERGDLIPRYTMITKFDIRREPEAFNVRQAIGGLVVAIFIFFVEILWRPVVLFGIMFVLYKRFKKA
ncbi:uncharacterized protein EAF01_000117 [Botrytis porri]|uniref:Uncharacterized protein n=1 Tax=Botrytis porri TaxID=87229 RepID=A0A4Z1L2D8_9HELO|nr:uncharacterized protein EAF01_000117 [Botrytis porri]KAF7913711.1 hypothetical protein EAF01_000117 [Botrytis porri]TGO91002.1 hypothetical protein BPOR_0043g00130 [Botrytis porri]